LFSLAVIFVSSTFAADFWQAKPFTEWSEKEIQRLLTNSPWAKPVIASMAEAMQAAPAGRPSNTNDSNEPGMMTARGTIPSTASSSRDQSGNRAPLQVVVRWQTALPVRQALMRVKFGAEAPSSAEARRFVEQDPSNYIIGVSGLPRGMVTGNLEEVKRGLLRETTLHTRGKAVLHPSDIEFSPRQDSVELFFVFPKARPFALDDREVEFSTRVGAWGVKCKFRLKDLVYAGRLEL